MFITTLLADRVRRLRRKSPTSKSPTDRQVIAASGLFDADWYLTCYPDAAEGRGDALGHYLRRGAREGRAAGPNFDTGAYLAANPDVAESGGNPLAHYVRHGAAEGRVFATPRSLVADWTGRDRDTSPVTFSILLATGGRPEGLDRTLGSLLALPGGAFEVIVEACGALPRTADALRSAGRPVAVAGVDATGGAFLRHAVTAARHDFVVVLDAGDVVVADALALLAQFIAVSDGDLVYSDESMAGAGAAEEAPVLKPSWSPELLGAGNALGRLTAIRRSVALAALPESGDRDAAEWELNLRAAERTRAIEHLPMILCRRSAASRAAAASPGPGDPPRAARRRADRPLVSIIVVSEGSAEPLRICTDGLYGATAYEGFELIVVDVGVADPETRALYESLAARGARIVPSEVRGHRSRANNLGASVARGELLLFLAAQTEVIRPDWLDELVRQAGEPGVGIVGPKLLDPDGTVAQAGIVLGPSMLAAPLPHRATEGGSPFGSPDTTRTCTAVAGACQLVRRSVFELVAGYDERFRAGYGDVVLCLEAARLGFRTVYLPSSVLRHRDPPAPDAAQAAHDRGSFARRLSGLGFAEDPYCRSGPDGRGVLRLWQGALAIGPSPLQEAVARLAGTAEGPLDLFDDGAVAAAAGIPWRSVTWRFDPARIEPGLPGAARIVLELLRRRRDLRARFPGALGDGARGGFAVWVKSEGLGLLGLGPDHAPWIDRVFEADPGARARQILVYDGDLRRNQPLFLLPSGRAETCRTLFRAVREDALPREEAWWFLLASAEDPRAALCRTWALTPSWQAAVPDGGTMFGLPDLIAWVAETFGIHDDWLYAQTCPEHMTAAEQVRLAYRSREAWRRQFPDALSDPAEAEALLGHLARPPGTHPLTRAWLAEHLAASPPRAALGQNGSDEGLAHRVVRRGVNILGHFSYPSGLRVSAESIVEGLRTQGVAVSLRDVPTDRTLDDPIGPGFEGLEIYDTTLIHVQPEPFFPQAYRRAGLRPRDERTYRIGYWYWEFDEVLASWDRAAFECDELWTATEFVAEGLRRRYRQPVHVLFPGVEIAPFERRPRSAFGLAEDEFVFLFVFHMASVIDRKNPLGLIAAFKEAFRGEGRARLVIKTTFGGHFPEAFEALRAAAAGANVTIIDRTFSRDETLGLIAACDAYVSLHRSEGLGLTMAEAMLLGRPVVATGYSGNLAFMDDRNSLLVAHEMVTLDHDVPNYRAGQRWAEPSLAHAARQMRRLFDEPAFARDLGDRAKRDLEERLSYRATARLIAERLAAIAAMR